MDKSYSSLKSFKEKSPSGTKYIHFYMTSFPHRTLRQEFESELESLFVNFLADQMLLKLSQ